MWKFDKETPYMERNKKTTVFPINMCIP